MYRKPDTADNALIARLVATKRVPQPAIASIDYYSQGNFTIALVRVEKRNGGTRDLVGVAKRNCADDKDDPRRGKDIALTRALQRLNPPGQKKPVQAIIAT